MARTYRVDGMTCGGCAASVERAIKAAVPGASVSVDLGKKAVTVDGATDEATDDGRIRQAVEAAGFTYEGVAA